MGHLPPVIVLPCARDIQCMANWAKENRLQQWRAKRIEYYVELYSDRFQCYFKSMRNHARKHQWVRLGAAYNMLHGVPNTPAGSIGMRNALEALMLEEFGLEALTPAQLFPVAAQQGPQLYGTRLPAQTFHDRICLGLKQMTGNHSGTGLGRSSSSSAPSAGIAHGLGPLKDCAKRQASLASDPAKKAKTHPGNRHQAGGSGSA